MEITVCGDVPTSSTLTYGFIRFTGRNLAPPLVFGALQLDPVLHSGGRAMGDRSSDLLSFLKSAPSGCGARGASVASGAAASRDGAPRKVRRGARLFFARRGAARTRRARVLVDASPSMRRSRL